jgi:hypothetical protein
MLTGNSTSSYSRVGQPQGSNGWQARGSELMDTDGAETMSPIRGAGTAAAQSAPSFAFRHAARTGYSLTSTSLTTTSASSSTRWREQKEANLDESDSSEDEEEKEEEEERDEADEDQQGVELTEAAIQPRQDRSIDPPKGASRGKKDPARKNRATLGVAQTAAGAGPGSAGKPKKPRKRKARKTVVAVDPSDENWVVRHLLSERG